MQRKCVYKNIKCLRLLSWIQTTSAADSTHSSCDAFTVHTTISVQLWPSGASLRSSVGSFGFSLRISSALEGALLASFLPVKFPLVKIKMDERVFLWCLVGCSQTQTRPVGPEFKPGLRFSEPPSVIYYSCFHVFTLGFWFCSSFLWSCSDKANRSPGINKVFWMVLPAADVRRWTAEHFIFVYSTKKTDWQSNKVTNVGDSSSLVVIKDAPCLFLALI